MTNKNYQEMVDDCICNNQSLSQVEREFIDQLDFQFESGDMSLNKEQVLALEKLWNKVERPA